MTSDGMYAIYRALKEVLEKPTPARVKKFTTNYFKHFTDFYFNKTKNWKIGVNNFISITNAINSGHFSLDAFCVIFIGYYITKNKFITQREMQYIDNLMKLNKFYSLYETQKQMEFINKQMEESVDPNDVFADFTETKLDVYKVGEDQKNVLYEYIKSGKVNLLQFVIAWHNKKFEIDEKKITDEDYFRFIQYMKIVRHNMYKVTQTTV